MDVVLLIEVFDVDVDGGVADFELVGDVVVGEVLEEEFEDLLTARGGWAVEAWAVFALRWSGAWKFLGLGMSRP